MAPPRALEGARTSAAEGPRPPLREARVSRVVIMSGASAPAASASAILARRAAPRMARRGGTPRRAVAPPLLASRCRVAAVAPLRRAASAFAPRAAAAPPHRATVNASASPVEYPLDSGGAGWDAVDLHARAGLAWSFTTPSSTDGRKIVKAACEARGVSLKGSSNFRKEDWESVAEQADVRLLDTFSTLPGMRGFRACWADHGVALLYVPGVRRFYTVADVAAGVADEKAKKDAAGVIAALEALCRVRPGFAEAYAIATDPAKAAAAAERASADPTDGAAARASSASSRAASPAPAAYDDPQTSVARWCVGRGVDAATLYGEFGVGFDFHGPAGSVSMSIIAAAAAAAGDALPEDVDRTWAKSEWVEAMEALGVTYRSTHAPLASLGRSWKVCWVADAVDVGCPAVTIWAPERNAYYTLGSLAAAAADAPAPVEAAIRAVVGVAKSTPAPQGLKAALTRDADFLTLLGRKPTDANAQVSVGTTGGTDAARAADEAAGIGVGIGVGVASESAAEEKEEVEEMVVVEDDADVEEDDFAATAEPSSSASSSSDEDFFRPAPPLDDFEWADSREGLRRRPARDASDVSDDVAEWVAEDMATAPMTAPGFEDVPGMEGFVADERVTGQGEFFSRSAGYLSFVDGSWSSEDLAREMGMDAGRERYDDPPVTPRDFPDLSRQSAGDAELVATLDDDEDFKELVPRGLPRAFEMYHPLRLHGCDYLVARTNDGRLDFREVMLARRRDDGHFDGEAVRVDTSAFADAPPAYYHEVAWTEREILKEEKHNPDGGPTDYDTLVERTTRVYLVQAETPFDDENAYNRKLDFTKPVAVLDVGGACRRTEVRGAKEHPDGVLVIRDGEMFVEAAEALPNWEATCHAWEVERELRAKELAGPELHDDFLKEVADEYVPDDTPEVDNF